MTRDTILLTGARGQVGRELEPLLRRLGDVVATDRATLDLRDRDAIAATMRRVRPSIVVNAAAYTAVDRAETDEAAARRINALAPGVLADEAAACGADSIHVDLGRSVQLDAVADDPADVRPVDRDHDPLRRR